VSVVVERHVPFYVHVVTGVNSDAPECALPDAVGASKQIDDVDNLR
jgi:hypothetical protein